MGRKPESVSHCHDSHNDRALGVNLEHRADQDFSVRTFTDSEVEYDALFSV